jgi:hypothetical protein
MPPRHADAALKRRKKKEKASKKESKATLV